MNYEVSRETLDNINTMNTIFDNILNICSNKKVLVLWAKDAKLFSNYDHYKILYPLASIINNAKMNFNVIVFDDDSKYIDYIQSHLEDDINVFISNIITSTEDKIIISEDVINIRDKKLQTINFNLHTTSTNTIAHNYQKQFDQYINIL